MKILLTTGYIGKRLLPILIEQGHDVFVAGEIKIGSTYRKNSKKYYCN
jgi:nucleoside-diphosphate-sugar epimerase